jgi:glycosyltransferase involved in cell wall biosynthesis
MPNVLIFSPDFDGHRQVYVFVMAHVLRELGFKIFIAGNIHQTYSNSFYLDKLKKNEDIKIIDTSNYAEGGINISAIEFLELQIVCESDLTVFAEADNHIPLFVSQIFKNKNRLRGKIVGVFLRPFYYYYQKSLSDQLKYLKHLPSRWRNDEKLFYEYFLHRFSLLNKVLCIDENFADHHQYIKWLPDIFQEYADSIVKEEKSEQRIWIERLNEFKEKNKGRFLFLYFGTAQYRRGYDTLLKMANESDSSFIHCGLRNDNERYIHDIEELRTSLSKSGRLFETDQYIEDPFCIECFFKSVSHLVLPYRNFFGSSGVMLQALSFGIPVLAPDNGIIGYRIKTHYLGSTYNDKESSSLHTQFEYFKKLDPKVFENSIKNYMNHQSTEQLKRVLVSTFTD